MCGYCNQLILGGIFRGCYRKKENSLKRKKISFDFIFIQFIKKKYIKLGGEFVFFFLV